MNKETFKSVTLVALFLLCIVLTGQLTLSLSTDQKAGSTQVLAVAKTFDIRKVFSPQSYIFSFGGGIYTQNYSALNSELWSEVQSELAEYMSQEDLPAKLVSIDEARWVNLVKGRAVRFRMPYYMSLPEMQSMLNMEEAPQDIDIRFNTILISTHSPDAIYFGDERQYAYYKLSGNTWSTEINNMIGQVENSTGIEYRRVEDLFGLGEALRNVSDHENNSIFPITSMRVDFVNVTPEVDVFASDESGLKSYANKAFGKQFNFVKKMRDVDGSVIYLYGYANKALRLGADGSVEYTQRPEQNMKSDRITLREAVGLALDYVDQYGGAPGSLYISGYEQSVDANDNTVTAIEFDYRIKDLPIISKSSYSVRVEMIGHQVINFHRKIHRYKDSFTLDVWPRALTINEVLERNSVMIQSDYESMIPEGLNLSSAEIWTRILGDISHVELGYFLESNKEYLHPVWKLDIGTKSYAFRLYDGRLLHEETR